MNEPNDEFSISAVRAKRAQYSFTPAGEEPAFVPRDPTAAPLSAIAPVLAPGAGKKNTGVAVDGWRLVAALKAHVRLLGCAAGGAAVVAFVLGYFLSHDSVRVTLLAREPANAPALDSGAEAYRPRQLNPLTLVRLMQSPELLRRAAGNSPTIGESALPGRVRVEQIPGADLVALTVTGKPPEALVYLANRFAGEAVEMGRELQAAEAGQMNRFYLDKLTALDKQLAQLNTELVAFQQTEQLADPEAEKQGYVKELGDVMARGDNARIEAELVELQISTLQNELLQENPIAQKLAAARNQLTDLYGRYTEAHPRVIQQRKLIAELEKELPATGTDSLASARYSNDPQVTANYARLVELQTRRMTLQRELKELAKLKTTLLASVAGLSEKGLRYATIKAQLDGLQKSRAQLAARQHEAQLYQANAQGYYRVFTPATLQDVDSSGRWLAAGCAGIIGLLVGTLGAGLIVTGRELTDRRLKTATELQRETGLPVLASVGDLSQMSASEKESWAFRAWTAIAGQLNGSPNRGLVCGLISSSAGEGRSTWIKLLMGAAQQRGLQVMTVATRPDSARTEESDLPANVVSQDFSSPGARVAAPTHTMATRPSNMPPASRPARTAHIPLPGKVWDLAHRKEWETTLAHLQRMDNLVLLVELPPASQPEAVLLAESLPQVIWLADSGKAGVRDTRQQLQTLRHAKCRLVGAVLNHEPKPVFDL